jgi:GNAT superfamily N-acetyltransferase
VVGGALIRELSEEDAAAVAQLELAVNPHQVATPASIWHRASRRIEREQRLEWVVELDGEIAGSAFAGFEWAVPTRGKGRFWLGVHPERRGRGLGDALYREVEKYLRARGAWRLRTWVDGDPAGTRFLERRGFRCRGFDVVSALELLEAELPEPSVPVVPLGEVRDRIDDLYAICAAGEVDMPGDEPETELDLAGWKLDDFGAPDLSDEGSFVALDGKRPVALAFLTVDPARKLAYNLMTATLPGFRRQGFGLAVKTAAARWAATNGFERILTENESGNAGMLAINDRLGYEPLYEQTSWVLEREGPPGERR